MLLAAGFLLLLAAAAAPCYYVLSYASWLLYYRPQFTAGDSFMKLFVLIYLEEVGR